MSAVYWFFIVLLCIAGAVAVIIPVAFVLCAATDWFEDVAVPKLKERFRGRGK